MTTHFNIEELDFLVDNFHRLEPAEQQHTIRLIDKHNNEQRVSAAVDDFFAFVKEVWPDFIPGAHHRLMADAFNRVAEGTCKRLIINMAPRHCLTLDTPVATTDGWKTMATVNPGDHVFGPDGKPTRVLGKSDTRKARRIYEVETDDGHVIETDAGHLWTVRLNRKHDAYRTYTTEQLFARQNATNPDKVRSPKLPCHEAIAFPEKDLPLDPYTLGLWLGDGTSLQAIITSDDHDMPHVRARIEAAGLKTTDQKTPKTFGLPGVKAILRDIGVLGNKHIPEIYQTASIAQRRDLLKGLMDSDGNVKKDGQSFFSGSNKRLVKGAQRLINGLGMKGSFLTTRAKLNGQDYGETYRVSFYGRDVATLPRKAERSKDTMPRYIRTIRETDRYEDVQCIEVDRGDGLFLAGNGCVVTHNTKSEFASYLLPAWFLGKFPKKKIIQCCNTQDLASNFGRKVRDLIKDDDNYANIFGNVDLAADSKSKNHWHTNHKGEYFAIGVNGRVTGKGADIMIIDDPHDEQEAKQMRPEVFDPVYEWFQAGPRQRLQPGAAIIIVMTRWSKRDLTGRVVKRMTEDKSADQWEVIEFPALLDENTPDERPLWPGFWKLSELRATRASIVNVHLWQGPYQQNPTAATSSILPESGWKIWPHENPPPCKFILQSWDTALTEKERSDYSACTTWGIFETRHEDPDTGQESLVDNAILLDAVKQKLEFPALKKKVREMNSKWLPDSILIESKNSGMSLLQEMRAVPLPVEDFAVTRGRRGVPNDKIARANQVTSLFSSGRVWCPERRFSSEVMAECQDFPAGEHDDYVDSMVQAMIRLRGGGLIRDEHDGSEHDDEDEISTRPRSRKYY